MTVVNFHNFSSVQNIFHPAAIVIHPDGRIIAAGFPRAPDGYDVAASRPAACSIPCFNGTGKLVGDTGDVVVRFDRPGAPGQRRPRGGQRREHERTAPVVLGHALQRLSPPGLLPVRLGGADRRRPGGHRDDHGRPDRQAPLARPRSHYAVTAGTAVNGVDFDATSGTLTFRQRPDARPRSRSRIPNDAAATGDKTVNLTLSNPSTGAILGTTPTAVLTIQNGPGQFQFPLEKYLVDENASDAIVTVDRTGGSRGTATVQFTTTPITATPGLDYTECQQTLTFANGVTSQTWTCPCSTTPRPDRRDDGGAVAGQPDRRRRRSARSATSTLSIYATRAGPGP